MKRCGFGAALLGVLLALCLGAQAFTAGVCGPVCRDLEEAAAAAGEGNWPAAEAAAARAEEGWNRHRRALGVLADHGPLEEIDGLYARLQVDGRLRARQPFAAGCARLERATAAVADAHRGTWWNLL